MQTFSIHRSSVDRLTRIGLACASDASPIANIGVRVTPTQVRFSATDRTDSKPNPPSSSARTATSRPA